FNLDYLQFSSNIRGEPGAESLADVPWASLISDVNTARTSGEILAPGYVFDLGARDSVGQSFSVLTYPGLAELRDRAFDALVGRIESQFPEYASILNRPEDLDLIDEGLFDLWQDLGDPTAFLPEDDLAFSFHILATATALTREEFVDQQTAAAMELRTAILADETASPGLVVLAADAGTWTQAYLAALEQAGILTTAGDLPRIRESAPVRSLMSLLAAGILAGPAGDEIITDGDLVGFFENVRHWYGHDAELLGASGVPDTAQFDLQLSSPTHAVAFNVYVPFNEDDISRVDVPAPDFTGLFELDGAADNLAVIAGPLAQGAEQFVPVGQPLPYAVHFANAFDAEIPVSEVRIVQQLDTQFDARTFRLGDIQIGDIQVHVPEDRGSFQGDFDFRAEKGYILRVSGGLDIESGVATWLLQAIDPFTGQLLDSPDRGLLPANNARGDGAGFVSYAIEPLRTMASGTEVFASARVLMNTLPPQDAEPITRTIDAVAPVTLISASALDAGASDYLVEWEAADDDAGSGVRHTTVYVAEDGGDYRIWLQQATESSGVFSGTLGHTYEFLALSTDLAGNRELPPFGARTPDDGSAVNLGGAPTFGRTTVPNLGTPPVPMPSTNPMFVVAQGQIPANIAETDPPEFTTVVQPFVAESFATGIVPSHADIGPMAIAVRPDGGVLVSGGPSRSDLYLLPEQGGIVDAPWASLPYPVFDLAMDASGSVWATTGGGPLLRLNAETGAVLDAFADGLTQSLAIDPTSGLIYVASSLGIEIFDPVTERFTHYSDLRAGNLALANDGALWAAVWPERGNVVRFDAAHQPQLMLEFDTAIDSLAFGHRDSMLAELLFVSSNDGELNMIDVTSLERVIIASGGTRGDIVETTADGRVLVSQSHQVDVLGPLEAPGVLAIDPPSQSTVVLPRGTVSVSFDHAMFAGASADTRSVTYAGNYTLVGASSGTYQVNSAAYDPATRTVVLSFDALVEDDYELRIQGAVESAAGVPMGADLTSSFSAINDLAPLVSLNFANARSSRAESTVSFDVTVTNVGTRDLTLPVQLLLDPAVYFTGVPQDASWLPDGIYVINLGPSLPPNGRLEPGQTTGGTVITIANPDSQHIDIGFGITALVADNQPPVFSYTPVTNAAVGQTYVDRASAIDPDDALVSYLLYSGPEGMTVDSVSGRVLWTPQAASP
ncbi:MAG: hypothetical protein KDA60_16755, partial [Planctomycetales bacterium]|nr:hypothetical protein [Planctomycetales bacterium]